MTLSLSITHHSINPSRKMSSSVRLLLSLFLFCVICVSSVRSVVCDCDPLEPNYDFATASSVSSFTASICPPTDADFYKIGVTNSSAYLSISLTSASDDVWCDHFVALASSPSVTSFVRSFTNLTSPLTVSVPAGVHYLRCYLRHPTSASSSSAYSVTTSFASGLCLTDLGESNNMKETATPISIPFVATTYYLCPNDQDDDWYTFSVSSYQSVQIFAKAAPAKDLFNSSVDGDAGLYLQMWNPRGDMREGPIFQLINSTLDLMPGTYYFRFTTEPVRSYLAPPTPPSVYSFSIQPTTHSCTPLGPSTNLSSPFPFNGTAPVLGRFCPVDMDFYLSFDVTADKPIQSYGFTFPGQAVPTAVLFRDGVIFGELTPRQIPGAAGGFYGTDRSILPPGTYVMRLRGDGFYTYPEDDRPEEYKHFEVAVGQYNSSYWLQGVSTPPPPDVYEPNDNMASAKPISSLPFAATFLNLYKSFEQDWFKFTFAESYNLFVTISTLYPEVEYSMSPFYTPQMDGHAIAKFFKEDGTQIAGPYIPFPTSSGSIESKYTFAFNAPSGSYMQITPGHRAPGHIVWQYNVTVIGSPSNSASGCGNATTAPVETTTAPATNSSTPTTTPPSTSPTPTNFTLPPFFIELGFHRPSPVLPRTSGPIWESLSVSYVRGQSLSIHFRSYNTFNLAGAQYPRINFFFDLDSNPQTGWSVRGTERSFGSELLLQGNSLFAQDKDSFNAGFLGTVSASQTMNIRECTLTVPLSIIRSVAPNASAIRLLGLNDEINSFAPAAGSYIVITL